MHNRTGAVEKGLIRITSRDITGKKPSVPYKKPHHPLKTTQLYFSVFKLLSMISLIVAFILLGFASADVRSEMLEKHNAYRRKHSAPDMTWHNGAAAFAQKHCDYLARTGTFDHSAKGSGFGELLYKVSHLLITSYNSRAPSKPRISATPIKN